MNLVQINILEAYAFLQYSLIAVAVEIESKFMKLKIINSLCCIAPSQGQDINLAMKQCFLTKIDRLPIPVWKLYITATYSEIFMVAPTIARPLALFEIYQNLPGAPVNFYIQFFSKTEVF